MIESRSSSTVTEHTTFTVPVTPPLSPSNVPVEEENINDVDFEESNNIDDLIMEQETARANAEAPVEIITAPTTEKLKKTDPDPKETLFTLLRKQVDQSFEELENIISSIYPKENYIIEICETNLFEDWATCVQKGIASALKCHIILYFEEIEISNSSERKHKIFDMFVKLVFEFRVTKVDLTTEDIIMVREFHTYLRGMRMSQANVEVPTNYLHSHLNSSAVLGGWGTFCLGTSPLSTDIVELKTGFTKEKFEIVLLSIPVYLQWESLEGTPYNYISRIYDREPRSADISEAVLENIALRFFTDFDFMDLDMSISMTEYSLSNTEISFTFADNAKYERLVQKAIILALNEDQIKAYFLPLQPATPYSPDLVKGDIIKLESKAAIRSFRGKDLTNYNYNLIKQTNVDEKKPKKCDQIQIPIPDSLHQCINNKIKRAIRYRSKDWLHKYRSSKKLGDRGGAK